MDARSGLYIPEGLAEGLDGFKVRVRVKVEVRVKDDLNSSRMMLI